MPLSLRVHPIFFWGIVDFYRFGDLSQHWVFSEGSVDLHFETSFFATMLLYTVFPHWVSFDVFLESSELLSSSCVSVSTALSVVNIIFAGFVFAGDVVLDLVLSAILFLSAFANETVFSIFTLVFSEGI